MIIKLKGADFSANNINSLLNSWPITFYGRTLVTGTFTSSISKGETYTATFSVADQCTVDSVSITRGGTTMSGATISDGTISISVPTTTESGPISITFNGSKENGDDPVDPDTPTGDGETNLTSQFTWTAGGVLWGDGKDRDDTNWLRSNYVDIGDYTQLRFTQAQTTTVGTVLGYAFYDSSKTYISGASNGGASSYAPAEKIIDVPASAKYIRTMWMNTTNANYNDSVNNISNFYCYGIGGSGSTTTYTFTVNPTPTTATVTLSASGYTTVSGTGSKSITVASGTNVSWTVSASGYDTQNGTQSVTSSSSKNVELTTSSGGGGGTGAETNLTSQFSWTPGTNNATAGSTSSGDTNWLYSNAVDVSAYSKIRFAHIQTSNSATTLGYTFYNSSMTAVQGATNGGTSYAPVDRTVDVPSGAKYFRCMWINTSNTNYDASIHDTSKFYCYGID